MKATKIALIFTESIISRHMEFFSLEDDSIYIPFGLDYGDNFSLVAKISSVRLFHALVIIHHWPVHHPDNKNSFLHRELEEEVYMDQPPLFLVSLNLFVGFIVLFMN